jgi:hypothetical protein
MTSTRPNGTQSGHSAAFRPLEPVQRNCYGHASIGQPNLKDSVAIAIDGEIFQDAWLKPIPPEAEVLVIPQIVRRRIRPPTREATFRSSEHALAATAPCKIVLAEVLGADTKAAVHPIPPIRAACSNAAAGVWIKFLGDVKLSTPGLPLFGR